MNTVYYEPTQDLAGPLSTTEASLTSTQTHNLCRTISPSRQRKCSRVDTTLLSREQLHRKFEMVQNELEQNDMHVEHFEQRLADLDREYCAEMKNLLALKQHLEQYQALIKGWNEFLTDLQVEHSLPLAARILKQNDVMEKSLEAKEYVATCEADIEFTQDLLGRNIRQTKLCDWQLKVAIRQRDSLEDTERDLVEALVEMQ